MSEDLTKLQTTPPVQTEEGSEGAGQVPQTILAAQGYASIFDYILKVDVPEKYRKEIEKLTPVLTQALALAYIPERSREREMNYYALLFETAMDWYKLGVPQYARQTLLKLAFKLYLSRSVDGFQQKMLVTTRQEQYLSAGGAPEMKPAEVRKEKKSFWSWRR